MTVWVLFVFMTYPFPQAVSYESKADCERAAAVYKRAACVKVEVPKQ